MNVLPTFDHGTAVIPCRTSEALLKILTELLDILRTNVNNNEPLNVHVVNSVLDLIRRFIEQSSIVQNPNISKSFSNLQTQLSNAKTFPLTNGQLMHSTLDTISKLGTKPLQYYIPSANLPSCKDAFSKLIDTAQNAYSHVYDLNTCERYKNSFVPMSYYEHSVNFYPNKPILQLPSENVVQYLQSPQANSGNLASSLPENYRPNNNNDLHIGYPQMPNPILTNNPIFNPTVGTSHSDFYPSIPSGNSMTSSNQPNASIIPQMPDNLQGFPEQISAQGQTIPNPVRFTINRYNNQHPTVLQPFQVENKPDLQKNKVLPNATYHFMSLEKLEYPNIPNQQQYLEKPTNVAGPIGKNNIPVVISPSYREVPSMVYRIPHPTSNLGNQSPPLQNDVLHKLLQAMKLTKVLKTPMTNQGKSELTSNLPNNKELTNIYPTMHHNMVESFNNHIPVPNQNLNSPIKYQVVYNSIIPQINPVEKLSPRATYNYQVNSLTQQQMPYNLVSNLPIGILTPNSQINTVIPTTFQNPNVNRPLNIPLSSTNPNDFKTLPVILPPFTQPNPNQEYLNQYLAPGFDNQIALQQNQITQSTQSRINNNILNQSRREVQNFTVYGKTLNLNQVSGVPNPKELNSVPSKTSIIELVYLLHQRMPINYSYVKYKIPYTALKNILEQKSAQNANTQELHKQLASNSEIEVSPELMYGSKEQIAQLVSTNGTFMSVIIHNGTDYTVKGLTTQTEGLPNHTLRILPLEPTITRKYMAEDAMNVKNLTKVLSDIQNLNSNIQSGRILERKVLPTEIEEGSKTEPSTYDSTTPKL